MFTCNEDYIILIMSLSIDDKITLFLHDQNENRIHSFENHRHRLSFPFFSVVHNCLWIGARFTLAFAKMLERWQHEKRDDDKIPINRLARRRQNPPANGCNRHKQVFRRCRFIRFLAEQIKNQTVDTQFYLPSSIFRFFFFVDCRAAHSPMVVQFWWKCYVRNIRFITAKRAASDNKTQQCIRSRKRRKRKRRKKNMKVRRQLETRRTAHCR